MVAERVMESAQARLAGHRRRGRARGPHARRRAPGRRHAGQRGELPHQEALHRRAGHGGRSPTRPAYDTVARCPVWGPSFGRGGATTAQQDLADADCILIEGSSMAEAHPVGFRWVMKAKERGATIIHVDPRFSRTSAMADLWVPIRAGTDIAFLGGLIRHVLENELLLPGVRRRLHQRARDPQEEFRDTEDLDGLFCGLDPESGSYDTDLVDVRGRRDRGGGGRARAHRRRRSARRRAPACAPRMSATRRSSTPAASSRC